MHLCLRAYLHVMKYKKTMTAPWLVILQSKPNSLTVYILSIQIGRSEQIDPRLHATERGI